ncbi:MAG TPA: class I SAM-dependent methyltransferase [Burkholderiales bacterium]|nr:class I SAM-dependent methyltransferase [Burkholderiales bacterium]
MPKSIAEVVAHNRRSGRGFDPRGEPRPYTDREFYEIAEELGHTQRHAAYRAVHERLAMWIRDSLPISTALEIGAGPGYLLYCMNKLGIDAYGVDGNELFQAFYREHHPEFAERYLLDRLFEKNYGPADAVVTIEVFEHIPEEGLHNILAKVQAQVRPKYIVFSSTPHADPNPGWDLQWGHINMKPAEEWQRLFRRYGYEVTQQPRPPVTEWAALYVAAGT